MATPLSQTPAGPPPQWYAHSPAPRHLNPVNMAGYALIGIGFIVFMIGTPIAAVTGFAASFVIALVGFGIITAGGMLIAVGAMTHRKPLPPPPPIRPAPSAPGGEGRAIEIACPNCGAAPRTIDRFGVATCEYCETRFLVR